MQEKLEKFKNQNSSQTFSKLLRNYDFLVQQLSVSLHQSVTINQINNRYFSSLATSPCSHKRRQDWRYSAPARTHIGEKVILQS